MQDKTTAANLGIRWPKRVNEIPREVLVSPALHELELERIFYGPEWHPVAHTGELPKRGDFKTFPLGKVPLLIVHDQDDEYRVFYNACMHRGNQLVPANLGNRSEFECPYHRWVFNSKGELIGCPNEREFSPGFKRADYSLGRPRMAMYCGIIFATMSTETPPIDEYLDDVKATFAETLGGDGRLRLLGYQKVNYKCNWKAYNDNDGYHPPLLHKAFAMLKWQGGKGRQILTRDRGHMAFEAELTQPSGTDALNDPSLIEFRGVDPSRGSRVVQLFPTFVLTKHLDVINARFAIPRGPQDTEVHYAYFCHEDDDADMVRHRIRQSSNLLGPCGMISMEDAAIFHRIHIGNHAPGNAVFQKGVKSFDEISYEVAQNDETGNLPRWDYYRRVMGFDRCA